MCLVACGFSRKRYMRNHDPYFLSQARVHLAQSLAQANQLFGFIRASTRSRDAALPANAIYFEIQSEAITVFPQHTVRAIFDSKSEVLNATPDDWPYVLIAKGLILPQRAAGLRAYTGNLLQIYAEGVSAVPSMALKDVAIVTYLSALHSAPRTFCPGGNDLALEMYRRAEAGCAAGWGHRPEILASD
ncbi:hypothetical protein BOTBODRAFT_46811 [Botryobasidium botryosum FD-172 SS1]|uniref:Uncharacterized protein n=1 Tax=Botryobasidium botryosum (strain FD-172 SS1) TaxID=930990 RepID=A0A067M4R1_BOTB1|nr:hypothetical protein BOTBODRAFT_46811 [Botryobasidium botryosum FD-172 SS1]